ncbi:MAG: hypothetical protein ACXW5W_05680 [Candidatus Binatia bacterium]
MIALICLSVTARWPMCHGAPGASRSMLTAPSRVPTRIRFEGVGDEYMVVPPWDKPMVIVLSS